jgi:hypothetical protein
MQDIGIHPLNLSPQAFYSYEAQPRWMDAPSPHPDPTCRPGLSTCFGRIHVAAAARPPTCWVCHPVSSGDPALCAVTWGGAYACNYVHTYNVTEPTLFRMCCSLFFIRAFQNALLGSCPSLRRHFARHQCRGALRWAICGMK